MYITNLSLTQANSHSRLKKKSEEILGKYRWNLEIRKLSIIVTQTKPFLWTNFCFLVELISNCAQFNLRVVLLQYLFRHIYIIQFIQTIFILPFRFKRRVRVTCRHAWLFRGKKNCFLNQVFRNGINLKIKINTGSAFSFVSFLNHCWCGWSNTYKKDMRNCAL